MDGRQWRDVLSGIEKMCFKSSSEGSQGARIMD